MSPASSSLDATSKRLLAALALAILISVVILARSFINVFSPSEQISPQTQQSARDPAKTVSSVTEPQWISPQQSHNHAEQPADKESPFKDSVFGTPKNDAAVRKEMVHMQAENLRAMVKQNKLPKAYGDLTTERIDEMEKNGIIIE
jgi:LAS superfamily LD-carboxypeptidase LdcB